MQAQLSSAVAFLSRPPMLIAQQGTVQSIPNNANTPVTMDTPVYDNYGGLSNFSDLSAYTVAPGADGIYLITGGATLSTATTTQSVASLYIINGTTIVWGDTFTSSAGATYERPMSFDLVALNAGDVIRLHAFQNTGGAINTAVNVSGFPFLQLRWVATLSGTAGLAPPNPRTWSLGDVATPAMFNTEIRNAVRFLSYVPYCRAAQTTLQSVPNSTLTAITGFTDYNDNYSAFASDTWTCPVSGTYLVMAKVGVNTAANLQIALEAVISSTPANYYGDSVLGAGNTHASIVKTLRLTAGDTIKPACVQASGGANNTITGNSSTRFCALWMSA